MDLNLIWQTILIFAVATLLLRIGGRKSLSQMTIPEAVIMIAFGTLIIQPVTGHGLWTTFVIGAVLILSLMATEYFNLKSDNSESLITGKSVVLIENGQLNVNNLKKVRLTVDQLEAQLRKLGVASIQNVKYATLETNGQLGYMLKEEKQPATKKDLQNLIQLIQTGQVNQQGQSTVGENIFNEINHGDPTPPPQNLQ